MMRINFAQPVYGENAKRYFPVFADGTRRRANVHQSARRPMENVNWHFLRFFGKWDRVRLER